MKSYIIQVFYREKWHDLIELSSYPCTSVLLNYRKLFPNHIFRTMESVTYKKQNKIEEFGALFG